jgi:tripartite-type tricarboxylate transporter receptor subunit TctC
MPRVIAALAVTIGLVCGAMNAQAQSYPNRMVRLVVPFAPGGAPDVAARLVAQHLSTQTGQTFVVENRAGGGGIVGAQIVAEAAPDGYTLLVTSSSFVINPSFHKNMPFDVIRDFEPVSNICAVDGFILGVNPNIAAKTVGELVAFARSKPQAVAYSTPGSGNVLHLAGELFQMRTGTKMVHVPYRSGPQMVNAVIAGDVQMAFFLPHTSMPFIEAGKIRALGYGARERYPALPNVPTLREGGVADVELNTWTGMLAPAKTPPAVLERLHQEIKKALAAPGVREKLTEQGFRPIGDSPAEFKPFVAAQTARVAEIAKAAGINPE